MWTWDFIPPRTSAPPEYTKPEYNKPSVIDEREKTHGPFEKTAWIYNSFRAIISHYADDADLTAEMICSLDMEMMKNARILSGNAYEIDHWKDKAGYAELVVRSLEQEE